MTDKIMGLVDALEANPYKEGTASRTRYQIQARAAVVVALREALTERKPLDDEAIQGLLTNLAKDAERLQFIEHSPTHILTNRKGRWSFQRLTNYEYPTFKTLREAIDNARKGTP